MINQCLQSKDLKSKLNNEIIKNYKLTLTSSCTLFNDTQASIRPFNTHGKAFSGPISKFNSATDVYVVAGVNFCPNRTTPPKVSKHIRTGVVAQK